MKARPYGQMVRRAAGEPSVNHVAAIDVRRESGRGEDVVESQPRPLRRIGEAAATRMQAPKAIDVPSLEHPPNRHTWGAVHGVTTPGFARRRRTHRIAWSECIQVTRKNVAITSGLFQYRDDGHDFVGRLLDVPA